MFIIAKSMKKINGEMKCEQTVNPRVVPQGHFLATLTAHTVRKIRSYLLL